APVHNSCGPSRSAATPAPTPSGLLGPPPRLPSARRPRPPAVALVPLLARRRSPTSGPPAKPAGAWPDRTADAEWAGYAAIDTHSGAGVARAIDREPDGTRSLSRWNVAGRPSG